MVRVFLSLVVALGAAALIPPAPAWAAVPESLRTGAAGALQARHHEYLDIMFGEAVADAVGAFPEHVDKLSRLAGFIGAQAAQRQAAQNRIVDDVQALLALAVRVDGLAAQLVEASERLSAMQRGQSQVAGVSAQAAQSRRTWLANRSAIAHELGQIESRHEKVRAAAARYTQLADLAQGGRHPLQQRAARLQQDFNTALARHDARVSDDRDVQAQAVTDLGIWYERQKRRLEGLQSRIDAAHERWRTERDRSTTLRERATALTEAYNAAQASQDQAQSAQSALAAQMARDNSAREALLALQQQGKVLLEQTLSERKAREAVLAHARNAMSANHARLAADLQADRTRTEQAIRAASNELQVSLAAAREELGQAEAAIIERYGDDYISLHEAVSSWLGGEDASVLGTVPASTAPGAHELLALAVATSEAGQQIAASATTTLERDVLALQTRHQAVMARHADLVRRFQAGSMQLRTRQDALNKLLTHQLAERQRQLDALRGSAPELEQWGTVVAAAAALMDAEFRQVLSGLRTHEDTNARSGEQWRRLRGELQGAVATFPRLQQRFAQHKAALIDLPHGAALASQPDIAHALGRHLYRSSALQSLAPRADDAQRFATILAAQALARWSRRSEEGIWRFLEGRFRHVGQRGFEALD